MEFKKEYSLKNLNTFQIDVKAKYYTEFHSVSELSQILIDPIFISNKRLVLGEGSNVLFTKDFDGLILKNKIKGIEIIREQENEAWVKAGAGEIWHEFVVFCINKGLGGIENLSLIPGTVGAAPIQNIGAYGVEIKDAFENLDAIEIVTGTPKTFSLSECYFGYRNSVFKQHLKDQYIITHVTFKLSKKPVLNTSYGAIQATLKEMGINEISIQSISNAVCKIRRSKLPDPAMIGNAGSFFKNPEITEDHFQQLKSLYPDIPSYNTTPGMVKIPAGWLNEQCGWKGKIVGNTGVHKDQALVLVNHGAATGDEVKSLATAIQKSVKEKFGIELETEVNII